MVDVELIFGFADGTRRGCRDAIAVAVEATDGEPCSSFEVELLYSDAAAEAARKCVSIQIYAGGELRFTGVVDEAVVRRDGASGSVLEICGRSFAAKLIDHELGGCEFASAGWGDVRRYCVEVCGDLAVRADRDLGVVSRFSITSGTSAWKALSDWAGAAAGVKPRFDEAGVLCLERKVSGAKRLRVGSASAVLSAERRWCLRGLPKEVLISERASGRRLVIRSEALSALGASGSAAIAAPTTALETRRGAAEWLLKQAEREADVVEICVAGAFAARVGDEVEVALEGFPALIFVSSVRTSIDENGEMTTVGGYAV